MTVLIQPGFLCILSGLAIVLMPVWWRLRLRAQRTTTYNLTLIRWLVRGLAAIFIAVAMAMAGISTDPHQQLCAAPMMYAGASGLMLADVVARMVVGPPAMSLERKWLRSYWLATTQIGVVGVVVGLGLLYAWKHV